METINVADEDWDLLLSFFPSNWKQLAQTSGALKGLRQDKSEENLLRVLLMHLGCGFSMRETVVRAKQARLADLSDVALLKRLRKSKDWLYQLCCALFAERGIKSDVTVGPVLRLMDSTVVKEPGQTGSCWRIHYSLRWPSLECDYFKVTATEGKGTGESLRQYPIGPGDLLLVDRGYCQASSIHHAAQQKAWTTVRLNAQGISLRTESGGAFPLLERLKRLQRPGEVAVWKLKVPFENHPAVPARLCVVRKSKTAIAAAIKKLKRKSSKQGTELQSETLIYAEYVMILTTWPEDTFPARLVLEWYRFRWQIELVFKRFKQIAELGHLPKHHDDSAKAWLYGKLLVALLTEKVIQQANALSPWGYPFQKQAHPEPVA
jgi:hypothetical protein